MSTQASQNPGQHKATPTVVYAQLKFMWANNCHEEALEYLRTFTNNLAQDLTVESSLTATHKVAKQKLDEMSKLLARCYFKQGQWQHALKKAEWTDVSEQIIWLDANAHDFFQEDIKNITHTYLLATHYDANWYKAWHTWALTNFEVVSYLENQQHERKDDMRGVALSKHVVQALQGEPLSLGKNQ